MNRSLAIYLARQPNVAVSFLVPSCSEEDKRMARNHKIIIFEARQRPVYDPVDCLIDIPTEGHKHLKFASK